MDENNMQSNDVKAPIDSKTLPRKHKLEIQVYDVDWEDADRNNGKPTLRPVARGGALDDGKPLIIEVANKAEFDEIQKQYALCEQRIKVIREIDPFVDEPKKTPKANKTIPQNNQAIPVEPKPVSQRMQNDEMQLQEPQQNATQLTQIMKPKLKPKIVTIGDVEVKYDGDKVYQKQWMKLTPSEASNFRIVTDSNNKVVSMAGKHIEAKRWVLLEDHSEDSIEDTVESILNN